MPFVNFDDLPEYQQEEIRDMHSRWDPEEFHRFKFFIKADGEVSRRRGHHTLTDAEDEKIMDMLRAPDPRTKGDLSHYRTAFFGL
jgi:hypothetical protein